MAGRMGVGRGAHMAVMVSLWKVTKAMRLRRQTQRTRSPGLHGSSQALLLSVSGCDQPMYTVAETRPRLTEFF